MSEDAIESDQGGLKRGTNALEPGGGWEVDARVRSLFHNPSVSRSTWRKRTEKGMVMMSVSNRFRSEIQTPIPPSSSPASVLGRGLVAVTGLAQWLVVIGVPEARIFRTVDGDDVVHLLRRCDGSGCRVKFERIAADRMTPAESLAVFLPPVPVPASCGAPAPAVVVPVVLGLVLGAVPNTGGYEFRTEVLPAWNPGSQIFAAMIWIARSEECATAAEEDRSSITR